MSTSSLTETIFSPLNLKIQVNNSECSDLLFVIEDFENTLDLVHVLAGVPIKNGCLLTHDLENPFDLTLINIIT